MRTKNKTKIQIISVISIIIIVLALRFGIIAMYALLEDLGGMTFIDSMKIIFNNPKCIISTIFFPYIFVRLAWHLKWTSSTTISRSVSLMLIIFINALVITLITLRFNIKCIFSIYGQTIYLSNLVFSALITSLYYLFFYFKDSSEVMTNMILSSRKTQYKYTVLKRQLDPHFLFNSLSILDYLVQEKETQRASDYIQKLALTYRYLLKQDQYVLVPLEQELEFVNMYIDLLSERFPNCFQVKLDIGEDMLKMGVVPCSLQILVENAFKHNIVNKSNLLYITIFTEKKYIVIQNPIKRKENVQNSAKKGLKNVKEQYRVISGEKVIVYDNNEDFIVKLPLIKY